MERIITLGTTNLEFSVLAESAEYLKVRGPSGRIKRLARPKKKVEEPNPIEESINAWIEATPGPCARCGHTTMQHAAPNTECVEFECDCAAFVPPTDAESAEIDRRNAEYEAEADAIQAGVMPHIPPRIPVGRRELPVVVTREEKDEASQKMCQLLEIIEDHEARKKEFTSQWKADLEGYQGDLNKNARIVRKDTVLRQVECEKEIDYEAGVARFYRRDTGEMFQERKLEQDEVQPTLDIEVADEPDDEDFDDNVFAEE